MNELTKRILTSLLLLIILYIALSNTLFLLIVLLIIIYILINEFNNILKKILKYKKILHVLSLFFVISYLYYFSIYIYLFLSSQNQNNLILFVYILSICISTDIGGYVFGKIFKGKKLTKISPNKTYSGLFGSFFLSILVSIVFFRDLNLFENYLIVTIILSFLSQTGDLIVSFLKRKAKLKDTGLFLPGHGGLLDRLDGILLTVPIGILIISL
tara:strand:+ start:429 stop:1070 length:642 start_codon:yes stop_codon:yes gene_type:complete